MYKLNIIYNYFSIFYLLFGVGDAFLWLEVLFLSKTTKTNLLVSLHEEVCIDFNLSFLSLSRSLTLFRSLSLSLALSRSLSLSLALSRSLSLSLSLSLLPLSPYLPLSISLSLSNSSPFMAFYGRFHPCFLDASSYDYK